jgi:hypothetical protein
VRGGEGGGGRAEEEKRGWLNPCHYLYNTLTSPFSVS